MDWRVEMNTNDLVQPNKEGYSPTEAVDADRTRSGNIIGPVRLRV